MVEHFFQLISAPCRAPDLVIAYNLSSTSLAVKWRHLPEKYFQGEPLSYKITYIPIALENNINVFTVNYTSNTTTLTNLAVYTLYVINVSAVSSGGIGPANTVKARTGAEGKMVLNKNFPKREQRETMQNLTLGLYPRHTADNNYEHNRTSCSAFK